MAAKTERDQPWTRFIIVETAGVWHWELRKGRSILAKGRDVPTQRRAKHGLLQMLSAVKVAAQARWEYLDA